MKKLLLITFILCMAATVHAQVTIGAGKEPEKFSALELISNGDAGLRMPLLTTKERNIMAETYKSDPDKNDLAKGLTIFNTTTNCLEFWNGKKWISSCEGEEPPYTPATPDSKATVTACAESSELASVGDNTGFYMFTYQTMNLYANSSGDAPTSWQWVVDEKLVPGATSATFAYTPPADLALETDALGNRKKTVKITCQMEIGGNEVQPVKDFEILVVYGGTGKGELYPIYVWGHENGVAGATSVKVAFAHVNLGAEKDTDPCGCLGDMYQWGRVADGHEKRTPLSGTTDVQSTVAPPGHSDFIIGFTNWVSSDLTTLWGDGSQDYEQDWTISADNPCPTGWKVPSQKQWSALYQGGTISGTPGASTSGSTWTNQGGFYPNSTSGYKVANALYLPASGYRDDTDGLLSNIGTSSYYWSSTAYGSSSFYMGIFINMVNSYLTHRAYGFAVRCVPE